MLPSTYRWLLFATTGAQQPLHSWFPPCLVQLPLTLLVSASGDSRLSPSFRFHLVAPPLPSAPWELILRVKVLPVPRLEVLIIHKFSSFFGHIKLIDYLPVVTTEGNSYPFNTCKNRILKSRIKIASGKEFVCLLGSGGCRRRHPAVEGAAISP